MVSKPISEDWLKVSKKEDKIYRRVVMRGHNMIKEKKIKADDEGFVAPLKLVEVLKDIIALKLNKYQLVDWFYI